MNYYHRVLTLLGLSKKTSLKPSRLLFTDGVLKPGKTPCHAYLPAMRSLAKILRAKHPTLSTSLGSLEGSQLPVFLLEPTWDA